MLASVNGDGIPDVILADYDGGIYMRGLANGADGKRYSHHAQAPRLYIRRDWVQGRVHEALVQKQMVNATPEEDMNDPYHSYFEYYYSDDHKEDLLRGSTANHLGHDSEEAEALKERRTRRVSHKRETAEDKKEDEAQTTSEEAEAKPDDKEVATEEQQESPAESDADDSKEDNS